MNEQLIERQWVDIVQPAMPQANHLLWWLLISILIIIASAIYYFLYYRQPRQQLTRAIRSLLKHVSVSANSKSILHQLERTLCEYHGIASLAYRHTLNQDWWPLLDALTCYRYQKQSPSMHQTIDLLQQCLQLLAKK